MQQHGSNILPTYPHPSIMGVKMSKFNFFQNMVMLHIKLKEILPSIFLKYFIFNYLRHKILKALVYARDYKILVRC